MSYESRFALEEKGQLPVLLVDMNLLANTSFGRLDASIPSIRGELQKGVRMETRNGKIAPRELFLAKF